MKNDNIRAVILAQPRTDVGKKVKKLRLEGWLPVHLYGRGIKPKALQVKLADFEKMLKEVGKTGLIDLKVGTDVKQVCIKNLQLHDNSYIPLHADFHYMSSQIRSINKKPALVRTLVEVVFAGLIVIVLFYLTLILIYHTETNKQSLGLAAYKETQRFPVRLKIPKINVNAFVDYVGITSAGAMDVPSNTSDVGWYQLGPSPGEIGSAVISGHFDGRTGESGVFNKLDQLQQGDILYVINGLGATTTFVVRESHRYNPGYADEVFFSNDHGTHLNLITCDGVWDKSKKSYSKRLVVFADIAQ